MATRIPDYAARIRFHDSDGIMEVDFSDIVFRDRQDVDRFYDEIDRRLEASGRHWFFLVNYKNCKIDPDAWVAFARRGRKSNLAFSLGTARYEPHEETGREILARSATEDFDPNLFASRAAAIAHLRELRADAEKRMAARPANGPGERQSRLRNGRRPDRH